MKRIFAALVAVMCMTGMTLVVNASTASAQEGCAGSYVACPPVTPAADGSVSIAGFAPGTAVTVNTLNAAGAVIGMQTVVADANGVVTFNIGGAAALQYTNPAGVVVTNTVIAAPARPAPAPAPAPKVVAQSNGPLVTTTQAAIATPKRPTITPAAAPKLAVTGGDVATPLLLGGALIAVGGMAIVASKRREVEFTS